MGVQLKLSGRGVELNSPFAPRLDGGANETLKEFGPTTLLIASPL